MSVRSLVTTKRISTTSQWQTFVKSFIRAQDGGESQLASKLRHCHPVYKTKPSSIRKRIVHDCWRRGVVVSGVRRMNEVNTHVGPG